MDSAPLLELMSEKASQRCDEIRSATKTEVDRIADEARQRGDALRARTLASLESELDAAATRMRERAESEAHMLTLTAKDTIADEVLAIVRAALSDAARGSNFPKHLEALLEELFVEIKLHIHEEGASQDMSQLTVLAPPAHVALCQQWLSNHGYGSLHVDAAPDLDDGVAVQDARPTFRITNTLSARLMKREGDMRRLCLSRLSSDDS